MNTKDLLYYNGFGGFSKDGKEYVICTNEDFTPLPWSHMMANEKFGCLVTANGGGYVWSGNSRENKITRWSNDAIEDPPSEKLWVEVEEKEKQYLLPYESLKDYEVRFGFGYAIFQRETSVISTNTFVFVPRNKCKKVYQIRLKNHTNEVKEGKIFYQIIPVLGVSREYTKKHLQFSQVEDTVLIQNYYRENYADETVWITSSGKINPYLIENQIVTISIPFILTARRGKATYY